MQCRRPGFDPWVGKIPWKRAWLPTAVFLPGESPWTEEPGGLQSTGSQSASTLIYPPQVQECVVHTITPNHCWLGLPLRMKIKEVKKENGDKKIVPKKKKPLKLGPIKKKELKKLVLYLKNGADCPCHQLDNLSHHFLIMGRKVKSQYLLTAIHKWDKKNKEFKNFMKKMKNHECPTFQSVFK
ncbi:hypothetical protein FD754_013611 [Muntiacus muntjak]|uniref:Secreted frizzled-related protein 1 n=1 Tax=Muntiacus muntjak TaxID=9888 RepID=A0A5N3VI04_MUNMU|nr:hypothetical protein FD754_013611 [Muntiacus muntjak]